MAKIYQMKFLKNKSLKSLNSNVPLRETEHGMTRVVILKSSLKIKGSILILLMRTMNNRRGFGDGSSAKVPSR